MTPGTQATRVAVPAEALLLSLLSLWVPVLSSSLFPNWTNEDVGILIWLLALVPAFLLSYYKGWQGASVALAAGMAMFALAQAIVSWTGSPIPPLDVMMGAIVVLVTVALGSGWLSTLHRQSLRNAEQLALSDVGTGMANRRHATLHLNRAFAAAERGASLTVVLFDLDRFKSVNDRYGHQAGDRILAAFAEILARHTREMHLSARYGGEEFLAVLDGVEPEEARIFADRVRIQLRESRFECGQVTVSAGVAGYQEGMASCEVLVAAADQALYRAKRGGRDRIEVLEARGRESAPSIRLTGEAASAREPAGAGELVLAIDDDPAVLRVVARALRRQGYEVLEAEGPREALSILDGRPRTIDLVVTDISMPEMSGFRLIEMLAERQREVRALYISGAGRKDVVWAGVPGTVKAFLPKPLSLDALRSAVRAVLDAPAPADASGGYVAAVAAGAEY